MDRKEKKEKKNYISKSIDLANGRYKDEEVNFLYKLAKNRSEYDGKAKTHKHSFTDWSSDGKYTRNEETTYTIRGDEKGVRIEEHYQYHDDDGQSGSCDRIFNTGREILNIIGKVLGE